MLEKIFGRSTSPRPDAKRVDEALSRFVLESPAAVRASLVSANGLLLGSFPRQAEQDQDRVAAMSAAMLSLGERISDELGSGELRHALIAGERTQQLLIVLNKDYALELELRKDTPLNSALDAVRDSASLLLRTLGLEVPTL
jgi:predicted regulator of Ras-like GTPase activity (Roadblock/LC7/MglB family)